jgi:hypothetical protein
VAFVLVGGQFSDELLERLPEDVRDSLMTHGPHDGPGDGPHDASAGAHA